MPKYIYQDNRNGKYVFQFGGKTIASGLPTAEAAVAVRNEKLGYDPDVSGTIQKDSLLLTELPGAQMEGQELWDHVIKLQVRDEQAVAARQWLPIYAPEDIPFSVTWFADLHGGNPHTDYITAKYEAELVGHTPGMYGALNGDLFDNWVGKLAFKQVDQVLPHNLEFKLVIDWLKIIADKTLWVCNGNHDLRTAKIANIDLFADYLPAVLQSKYYYDPFEVRVRLGIGDSVNWDIISRHDWPGRSIYSDSYGIERAWRFGSYEFDIGVGSHVHRGTSVRPFFAQGKRRYGVMTGAYKYEDGFQVMNGMVRNVTPGSVTSVFYPDGRVEWFNHVKSAAEFLGYLRNGGYRSER